MPSSASRSLVRTAAITAICLLPLGSVYGQSKADTAKPDTAKPAAAKKDPPKKEKVWQQMDYGPFLTASIISHPGAKFDNKTGAFSGDSTARGVAIKLSDEWRDGVVFDMDLMRISAGWTDGGLQLTGLISDGAHGPSPRLQTPPLFQTPHLPGVAGPAGEFTDPRPNTIDPLAPVGPLPKTWAHYRGLYRNGQQVILSYTVGSADVLELPTLEKSDQAKAIARTIRIEKASAPTAFMIADAAPVYPFPKAENPSPAPDFKPGEATIAADGQSAEVNGVHVALVHAPAAAKLEVLGTQLILRVPASEAPLEFKVLLGGGDASLFTAVAKASPEPVDLTTLTKGGPALWTEPVVTAGKLGEAKADEAYVVDNLTLPHKNPYNAWMRPGGFDFFGDGHRAAISTWSGDVWTVSGIDDKLEKLSWQRIATGLHQPLGLAIVKDQVYTVGHDQITHLVDLNGDGETDFYENVNNDWELTTAFHAFAFDLHADKDGSFLFAFGSPVRSGGGGFHKITQHHGTILRVSPDGSKLDVVATGFRAPNGIGLNLETGQITSGDNQGTWVPNSPIHWVKPGSFNGVVDSAHRDMKSAGGRADPSEAPKPICWLPHNVDNSSGGQVWVTSDRWGPFKGDLLHTSYGTSSLFKVMYEEVDGQMQGGVSKFPVKFSSSAMRPRFNPADGQLYVAGLKGWQTNAGSDGGLDRVRYTGKPVRMPTEIHATEKGIAITFTCPLDPETASDAGSYSVQAWLYQWSGNYGSADYKPSAPQERGKDEWPVKSAKLSADKKTVYLEIPDIKPVSQYKIDFNVDSGDGVELRDSIYGTIHKLGKPAVAAAQAAE